MFKDFRYSTDTLQDMEVIMLLIRISYSDTVRIHPRRGGHSISHSEFQVKIQFRYAPDTVAILSLIQIQLSTTSSDTLQTWMPFWPLHQQFDYPQCSRRGSHSATHTDLNSSYSLRYTPDTGVILSLIQIPVIVSDIL